LKGASDVVTGFESPRGTFLPHFSARAYVSISESDWKHLRRVHAAALDRFCAQVLQECQALASESGRPAHDTYLLLFELIIERNQALAAAFDDMRRSNAVHRLAAMMDLGVVTPSELAGFSSATRETIARIVGVAEAAHPS
jgi:hypothetical protein